MKKYKEFINEAQTETKQSKYLNEISIMGASVEILFQKISEKWNQNKTAQNAPEGAQAGTTKPAQTETTTQEQPKQIQGQQTQVTKQTQVQPTSNQQTKPQQKQTTGNLPVK